MAGKDGGKGEKGKRGKGEKGKRGRGVYTELLLTSIKSKSYRG
jgi:hypothetical protein